MKIFILAAFAFTSFSTLANYTKFKKIQSSVCDNISTAVVVELNKLNKAEADIKNGDTLVLTSEILKGLMQLQAIQQKACRVLVEDKLVDVE